jgi:hypothetical protein
LNDFWLAKDLPQLGYGGGEGCVDDGEAGPHGLEQFLLSDYLTRMGK